MDSQLFPHLAWLVAAQFGLYALGWAFFSVILRSERAAIAHWSLFMLLIGLGFLLAAERDGTYQWLPYVGGGILFVTGTAVQRRGIALFFRVEPDDREMAFLLGAFGLAMIACGPERANASWRVLLVYGTGAWMIGRAVQRVVPSAIAEFGRAKLALAALSGVLASAAFALRAVAQIFDWSHPLEMQSANVLNHGAMYGTMATAAMFNFAFMAMVTLRLVRQLRIQASQDPLTKLPNRRALEEDLQHAWQRFQGGDAGFAVLALDLDHFKRINDRYGHLAGDAILEQVAHRLRITVRDGDVVARTGGEEFVVLLPETDADKAQALAQRLIDAVRAQPFALPGVALPITVSIGLTQARRNDGAALHVMKRADEALYRAKSEGRDRLAAAFA